MSLLTAADLASMRATATEALDTTAVIQTQSVVSDGGGGGTATWTAAGTVAARLSPYMSGGNSEGVEGDRLTTDSQVIFTFPAETEVDQNARILCGGATYEVTAIRQRSEELTRRIEAKERD